MSMDGNTAISSGAPARQYAAALIAIALISLATGCRSGIGSLPMDTWVPPVSLREIAVEHDLIFVGTVQAISNTFTVTETVDSEFLTAVAPDGYEEPLVIEETDLAFLVTDTLVTDGSVSDGRVISLRVLGTLPDGTPPFVGSTYLVLSHSSDYYSNPTFVAPFGGNYSLIQADDPDGPVRYAAHDETVYWASEYTVREFIEELRYIVDH